MRSNTVAKSIRESKRRRLRKLLTFSVIFSFSLFVTHWLRIQTDNRSRIEAGLHETRNMLEVLSIRLSERLKEREEHVADLAESLLLERNQLDLPSLTQHMRRFFYAGPGTQEVGLAIRPYFLGPQQRLFGWRMRLNDDKLETSQLDQEIDYTMDENGWYATGMKRHNGLWMQPVFNQKLRRTFATYILPVFLEGDSDDPDAKPIGVIYLKLALDRLQDALEQLPANNHGRAFMLAHDDTYLLHPNYDYLAEKRDYVSVHGDSKALRNVMSGEGTLRLREPDTRLMAYQLFEPIENGWKLGASIARIDLLPENNVKRRQGIQCLLLLLLALLLMGILVASYFVSGVPFLWIISTLVGVNFLFAIAGLFYLSIRFVDHSGDPRSPITTPKIIRKFKHDCIQNTLGTTENLPVFIPTGVYVQSVSFISSREIVLTGYIWQRYDTRMHADIERGFVMPENETADIEKAYERIDGDQQIIGWRFSVELNQRFDYSTYPLGMENIWIQLWHKDFAKNVVLVPDLGSYKLSEPFVRPGIRKDLELPSWRILETFFSYQSTTYRTDFGLGDYSGLTDFPELYFNIRLRKNLLGPAVSHLLPTTVVVIMLFSILLLSSREDTKMSLFGFDAMSVIGSCSGLFLAVVFAHIGLRDSLAVKGIVYLEHFYFVTYTLILWVAVNSLLFTKMDNRLVRYRENLISQLLYWPVSQGYILLMTLIDFY